jgi:hypothetical protein
VDARRRLLGDADEARDLLVPALGVLLELALDDGEDDLELGVVGRVRVGLRAVLGLGLLRLEALVDEEREVAAVVDDEVRADALAVVLGPRARGERALPLLLERLALPRKDGRRLRRRDRRRRVVLRREDVARAPADVTAARLRRGGKGRRRGRRKEGAEEWG